MNRARDTSLRAALRMAVAVVFGIAACFAASSSLAADAPFPPVGMLTAADTLTVGEESSADAKACLDGLCWKPGSFSVECRASGDAGDAYVCFPSPLPSGVESNDCVYLEWHAARDADGAPKRARAVVVVHESGSRMTVGRIIARDLQRHGLHAFLLHLPYYGERRQSTRRPDAAKLMTVLRQAVADVRRARDAVAALPLVDPGHIALQGTSLGGIVSSTVTGLDHGYDSIHLMLAGGNLYDLLQNGQRDAAKLRRELERAGVDDAALREITAAVEPTRLAHRADPGRVWLYTADYDQVVPKRNSERLAEALRLDPSHHIHFAADHYTGVVYLPFLLKQIAEQVQADAAGPESDDDKNQ